MTYLVWKPTLERLHVFAVLDHDGEEGERGKERDDAFCLELNPSELHVSPV